MATTVQPVPPFKGRKGRLQFVHAIGGLDSDESRVAAETAARALSAEVDAAPHAATVPEAATPDAAPVPPQTPPVPRKRKLPPSPALPAEEPTPEPTPRRRRRS